MTDLEIGKFPEAIFIGACRKRRIDVEIAIEEIIDGVDEDK